MLLQSGRCSKGGSSPAVLPCSECTWASWRKCPSCIPATRAGIKGDGLPERLAERPTRRRQSTKLCLDAAAKAQCMSLVAGGVHVHNCCRETTIWHLPLPVIHNSPI